MGEQWHGRTIKVKTSPLTTNFLWKKNLKKKWYLYTHACQEFTRHKININLYKFKNMKIKFLPFHFNNIITKVNTNFITFCLWTRKNTPAQTDLINAIWAFTICTGIFSSKQVKFNSLYTSLNSLKSASEPSVTKVLADILITPTKMEVKMRKWCNRKRTQGGRMP